MKIIFDFLYDVFRIKKMCDHNILWALYTFKPDSTLHPYLQNIIPGQYNQNAFTLVTLVTDFKNIIKKKNLFDVKNPAIILCDPDLESALNINGFHIKDIQKCLLNQLICVTPITPHQCPLVEKRKMFESQENVVPKIVTHIPNKYYILSPLFKSALSTVPFFPHNLQCFTLNEIYNYVSRYIIFKKNQLLDPRNITLAVVKNDPLGKAFNVNAFDRCQAVKLIKRNILPVKC
jgi:hypothetical protein